MEGREKVSAGKGGATLLAPEGKERKGKAAVSTRRWSERFCPMSAFQLLLSSTP